MMDWIERNWSQWLKVMVACIAATAFTMGTTACETTQGAGEDIENLGEEMDEEF